VDTTAANLVAEVNHKSMMIFFFIVHLVLSEVSRTHFKDCSSEGSFFLPRLPLSSLRAISEADMLATSNYPTAIKK
jgi:hypothetical protein